MKLFLIISIFSISIYGSTLAELESFALSHNPTLQKAKKGIEASRLKSKINRVKQFGEIDLVGSATHYNIERTLAPLPPSAMKSGQPITASKDIYSVGVSYSVALFTGFAQTRDIEIAKLAQTLSRAKYKLSKEEIIYNIRSLYLGTLAQRDFLKAQNRYISALKRLHNTIKQEVNLGRKAEIDLLKSLAQIEAQIVKKEQILANIKITKAALSALVGKKVTKLSSIKIRVNKPRYSVSSLVNRAYNLAKIQIEDIQIAKANKTIQKAKATKYPFVSANAYYGKNYGSDINTKKWDHKTNWQVGLNVKYNLIDFGKSNANIELAKLSKIQAKLQKNQTILNLKKSITQAIEQLKLQYASYIGNKSQLKLAKKAYYIEKVRYQNDLSTINDLLLAKSQEEFAKAKLIESKYNYKKAKYYLDYIMEKGVK